MPNVGTAVNRRDPRFDADRDAMLALLERVRDLEARSVALGEAQRARFETAGKRLPRERIDRLLDAGSPFIALSTLAGLGEHEDDGESMVMGGGVITGIGRVCGTRVMVIANDSAIKGGTSSWAGGRKIQRAQEIALRQKLPVVNLIESGGGNLRLTYLTFAEMSGRRFANQDACRRPAFRRWRWCMAMRRPAAPMHPVCPTT
ncbi:MAG: carboxyl transferase domain-containing protein [Burkholderiaceae bacterium]